MDYREKRSIASNSLFENFCPDFSKCRDAELGYKILEMARNGCYSHEIAEETGKTPKAIQKFFRRYNFPNLHNFSPPLREERQGWKGGVKEVKGYLYSRTPGHPYASKHGNYVAVHRLIVEEKIGRYLLPTEVVDHIDGDTRNNDPDNLRVFQSNAKHLAVTRKGKIPNGSEDSKASIDRARRKPRRTRKDSDTQPNRD